MSGNGKKSYTVPVLLLIITGISIPLILVYSKLLLAQQSMKVNEGHRMTQQYQHAILFAERLHNGADLMLKDASAADRLRAKVWLGEAAAVSGDSAEILAQAVRFKTGETHERALIPLLEAANRIISEQSGRLYRIAEHDGPLTVEEKDLLSIVRDGAANMRQALDDFRPPTGDVGYRHVEAGVGWVEPALSAGKALVQMAAKLK